MQVQLYKKRNTCFMRNQAPFMGTTRGSKHLHLILKVIKAVKENPVFIWFFKTLQNTQSIQHTDIAHPGKGLGL